jgi:hypothetical protein
MLVLPYAVEVFVAYYSGAQYEAEVMAYRLNGPYWWAYCAGFIFPLLPILGLFPFIGKRPVLMFAIAAMALIPITFTSVGEIIRQFSRS